MDELLRGFGGLWSLLTEIVGHIARFLQMLASAVNIPIDDFTARALSALAILIGIAYGVRWVLFPGKGLAMFKPQTVALHTDKTPAQIVAEDIGGCLTRVLLLTLFIILLILLSLTRS